MHNHSIVFSQSNNPSSVIAGIQECCKRATTNHYEEQDKK